MGDRTILHSDANCFYASVEMLYRPELRNLPMAVGGDPEARHGIVLTANYIAKRRGVKTGMALWEARQACPDVVFVPPRMDLYLTFSRLLRGIYGEYTDLVEPFGCDEAWLDVTDSAEIRGNGLHIAEEIRKRVKDELGLTVSIGLSYNKIFAKLGSDYKKPDAVTLMGRNEYRSKAWSLPASDLLYIGRATTRKLRTLGISTIGGVATSDPEILMKHLGKMGWILWLFANGYDETPVSKENAQAEIKSVGNSMTTPRDLLTDEDAKIVIYILAESVASRLRKHGFRCHTVEISVRDNGLYSFTRRKKLSYVTNTTTEIAEEAYRLFLDSYSWPAPIRSLGVRGADLVTDSYYEQLDLFNSFEKRQKMMLADAAVDDLRRRFGFYSVQRGLMLNDAALSHVNAEEDHTVHPRGYFGQ